MKLELIVDKINARLNYYETVVRLYVQVKLEAMHGGDLRFVFLLKSLYESW